MHNWAHDRYDAWYDMAVLYCIYSIYIICIACQSVVYAIVLTGEIAAFCMIRSQNRPGRGGAGARPAIALPNATYPPDFAPVVEKCVAYSPQYGLRLEID